MGSRHVPSVLLLVPGPWRRVHDVVDALGSASIQATVGGEAPFEAGSVTVDLIEDPGVGAAVADSLTSETPSGLAAELERTDRAVLVEIAGRLGDDLARTARLGRALRDAGGLAVRMERSGVARDWASWLRLLEERAGLLPLGVVICREEDSLFTCGMHHFDLPEGELDIDDEAEATRWLDAFARFLLLEAPAITPGHTFRPDERSPRRVLERWPDHRHARQDGRHNPFGIWRILREGQAGLEPLDPVPVPAPSLVSMLLAAERRKSRPLTEEEVEKLADEIPCIAMAIADIAKLERSRGYADIEPRLAWEQWNLVRTGF